MHYVPAKTVPETMRGSDTPTSSAVTMEGTLVIESS